MFILEIFTVYCQNFRKPASILTGSVPVYFNPANDFVSHVSDRDMFPIDSSGRGGGRGRGCRCLRSAISGGVRLRRGRLEQEESGEQDQGQEIGC